MAEARELRVQLATAETQLRELDRTGSLTDPQRDQLSTFYGSALTPEALGRPETRSALNQRVAEQQAAQQAQAQATQQQAMQMASMKQPRGKDTVAEGAEAYATGGQAEQQAQVVQ